jgi:hypothetical protein
LILVPLFKGDLGGFTIIKAMIIEDRSGGWASAGGYFEAIIAMLGGCWLVCLIISSVARLIDLMFSFQAGMSKFGRLAIGDLASFWHLVEFSARYA